MRIVPGFILREIAGETIAIPSGDSAHLLSGLAALNGSGKFLFELLQTNQTEDTLIDAMTGSYDIDRDSAQADVLEYLDFLRANRLLLEDNV